MHRPDILMVTARHLAGRWRDGRKRSRGRHVYFVVGLISEKRIDCPNGFRASGWTLREV